ARDRGAAGAGPAPGRPAPPARTPARETAAGDAAPPAAGPGADRAAAPRGFRRPPPAADQPPGHEASDRSSGVVLDGVARDGAAAVARRGTAHEGAAQPAVLPGRLPGDAAGVRRADGRQPVVLLPGPGGRAGPPRGKGILDGCRRLLPAALAAGRGTRT